MTGLALITISSTRMINIATYCLNSQPHISTCSWSYFTNVHTVVTRRGLQTGRHGQDSAGVFRQQLSLALVANLVPSPLIISELEQRCTTTTFRHRCSSANSNSRQRLPGGRVGRNSRNLWYAGRLLSHNQTNERCTQSEINKLDSDGVDVVRGSVGWVFSSSILRRRVLREWTERLVPRMRTNITSDLRTFARACKRFFGG